MADLIGINNGDTGLQSRDKINAGFTQVNANTAGLVVVGAQVNANNSLKSTNRQEQVTGFGNSITEDLNSYWIWAERKSEGQWKYKFNAGIGGDTTTQMLARLDDIPDGTTLVVVMEATNDAASAITVEQHAENMKAIFEAIIARGMRPILVMSPPHDDPTRSQRVDAMNLYDYNTAIAMNIGVYDCWSQFTDAIDGSWVSGASDDGTHPVPQTSQDAGYTLQDKYKNYKYYTPLPRNNANSGVNPNANFLTVASTNTPANWATNSSQVSKLLSETSLALGNTWKTNWVDTACFQNSSRFSVTAGDKYLFVLRCEAIFNSGSSPLNIYLEYDTAVGSPAVDRVYFVREAEVNIDATTLSAEFVVPEGVSTIRYAINCNTGAYDLDLSIGQAQFFNLTESTLPSLL